MQVRNEALAVGTSQVAVASQVAENQRTLICFTNTSTLGETITLSFGEQATAGAGVVLNPTKSWSESIDNTFRPYSGQIYAVASAATATLAVHERLG
jgi:hypothetical protein